MQQFPDRTMPVRNISKVSSKVREISEAEEWEMVGVTGTPLVYFAFCKPKNLCQLYTTFFSSAPYLRAIGIISPKLTQEVSNWYD